MTKVSSPKTRPRLPPEIIECILPHLSQTVIRRCIRLVCHEWDAICRKRYLWMAGHWKATLSKESRAQLLQKLGRINALSIWTMCDPEDPSLQKISVSEDKHSIAWHSFYQRMLTRHGMIHNPGSTRQPPLDHLQHRHPFRDLTVLRVSGYALSFDNYLGSLMPVLSKLNSLRLVFMDRQTFPVFTVLQGCPSLKDLYVEGDYCESVRVPLDPSLQRQFQDTAVPSPSHPLGTLTMRWVSIQATTVELLLKSCRQLNEIKLMEINRPYWKDEDDFYCQTLEDVWFLERVRQHCPEVRSVHQSSCDLLHMDPTFNSTLFLMFPRLETMSVLRLSGRDLDTALHHSRQLTTLEIVHSHSRNLVCNNLHQFLCQATALKHLLARDKFIDLADLIGDTPLYTDPKETGSQGRIHAKPLRKSKVKNALPSPPPRSSTWACMGLETLQLGFESNRVPALSGSEGVRRFYAHLAQSCLCLRHVEISHSTLDFGLWAGKRQDPPLRELATLDRLESLVLRTWVLRGHMDISDIDWMMECPLQKDHPCWPCLRMLKIQYKTTNLSEDHGSWVVLMEDVRPGLDFSIKQDPTIDF